MDFLSSAAAFLIGLLSGAFAGAFGVGGALITTPLFRIFLGVPAKIALGTPLPLVLPAAFSALYVFQKNNLPDYKLAFWIAIVGSFFAVFGALFTQEFNGEQMMFFTSLALFASAFVLSRDNPRNPRVRAKAKESNGLKFLKIILTGGFAGFVSGFLGIGAGFILVPLLVVLLGLPTHSAIATSLASMAVYVIPASAAHFSLGNIDVQLLATVLVGSVAGAAIGANKALETREEKLKNAMVVFLVVLAIALAAYEIFY